MTGLSAQRSPSRCWVPSWSGSERAESVVEIHSASLSMPPRLVPARRDTRAGPGGSKISVQPRRPFVRGWASISDLRARVIRGRTSIGRGVGQRSRGSQVGSRKRDGEDGAVRTTTDEIAGADMFRDLEARDPVAVESRTDLDRIAQCQRSVTNVKSAHAISSPPQDRTGPAATRRTHSACSVRQCVLDTRTATRCSRIELEPNHAPSSAARCHPPPRSGRTYADEHQRIYRRANNRDVNRQSRRRIPLIKDCSTPSEGTTRWRYGRASRSSMASTLLRSASFTPGRWSILITTLTRGAASPRS